MKKSVGSGLMLVLFAVSVSVFSQTGRLQVRPSTPSEAPPIVQARGELTSAQDRAPFEPLGFFRRSGVNGAADAYSKAYKRVIDKSKIAGPIELTVDHLSGGPDRYIEILAPAVLVPGMAKIPTSSTQSSCVRLHFKPFRPGVPHLLLWHVQNFHPQNAQSYVFKGSGIDAKQTAPSNSTAPLGIVVVPNDMTPFTISVSTTSGYWWRFYGVEVTMLNP